MSIHRTVAPIFVLLLAGPASANDSHSDGLVAWYPLDGNAHDASTSGHDGSVCGASTTQGHSGAGSLALEFDGVDDFVDLAEAKHDIGNLGQGTISVWFRLNQAPDQTGNKPNPKTGFPGVPQDDQLTFPVLFLGAVDPVNGNNSLMLHPIHPNQLPTAWFTLMRNALPADPTTTPPRPASRQLFCFDTCNPTNKATCDGPGPDVLVAGAWYHYAVTVDASGNHGYLNGVELVDRRFNPDRSAFPDTTLYPPGPGIPSEVTDTEFFNDVLVQDHLYLGTGYWAYGVNQKFMDGAIDELRIYDRVLSAAEVLALYQATDAADDDGSDDGSDNSCEDDDSSNHDDAIEERSEEVRWDGGWGDWFEGHCDNEESGDWWDNHWW